MQRIAIKNLSYKLKGNTLVEVLIAFAIICFCSGLASIIFINVQKSSQPFFRLKAVELAEMKMKEIIEEKDFSEETFKLEEFILKKKVVQKEAFPDCYIVRLLVFNSSQRKIHELESTFLIK